MQKHFHENVKEIQKMDHLSVILRLRLHASIDYYYILCVLFTISHAITCKQHFNVVGGGAYNRSCLFM